MTWWISYCWVTDTQFFKWVSIYWPTWCIAACHWTFRSFYCCSWNLKIQILIIQLKCTTICLCIVCGKSTTYEFDYWIWIAWPRSSLNVNSSSCRKCFVIIKSAISKCNLRIILYLQDSSIVGKIRIKHNIVQLSFAYCEELIDSSINWCQIRIFWICIRKFSSIFHLEHPILHVAKIWNLYSFYFKLRDILKVP